MARYLAALMITIGLASPSYAQTPSPKPVETQKVSGKSESKKASSQKRPAAPAGAADNGPCSIGVIPMIGDHFGVQTIGVMVFGNSYKDLVFANWGLDDLVVERVRAAAGPAVAVRRVVYTPGAFASYHPGWSLNPNNDGNLAEAFRKSGSPLRCERYVVVTRAAAQYTGNQNIAGIGVVNQGRPLRSHSAVHAVFRVHVHDGQTFVVLKSAFGSLNGDNFLTRETTRTIDDSMFPEQPENADTPKMRAAAQGLLTEMLDKSLPPLLAR